MPNIETTNTPLSGKLYLAGTIALSFSLAMISQETFLTTPILLGVAGASSLNLFKSVSLYLENESLKKQNQELKDDQLKTINKIRTVLNPRLKPENTNKIDSINDTKKPLWKSPGKILGTVAASLSFVAIAAKLAPYLKNMQPLPVLAASALTYNAIWMLRVESETTKLQADNARLTQNVNNNQLTLSQMIVLRRTTRVLNNLDNTAKTELMDNQVYQYIQTNPKLTGIFAAASTLSDNENLDKTVQDLLQTARKEITPPPIPEQVTNQL